MSSSIIVDSHSLEVKPAVYARLSLSRATILFAASALVLRLCVYSLMPMLLQAGIILFWAFLTSYSVALSLMMMAAFVGLWLEGCPIQWSTFRTRLRFHKLSFQCLFWVIGLFLIGFLGSGLLIPTAQWIARIPWFHPPSFLPAAVNPLIRPQISISQFMGVPLRGQWWIAISYLLFESFFDVFGEELWFRGYILPRQELVHGKQTWLIHGVLWTLFHVAIYPWYLLYLLPTALTVSFAAQKLENTWASYLVHFIGNVILALLPVIFGIVG
jgi:membrane protease YdiL (CAAX protease family)